MRVEELFDSEAFLAVERAVEEAERTTSAEIVPMVVDRSDDYPGVRAAGAAVLAFIGGICVLGLGLDPWLWLPPTQVGVFALASWSLGHRRILRHLIPARIRAERVDRTARLAFLENGLVDTRDRTGILIFISLLEHRVEILADRGIDRHVDDVVWDGLVERILAAIRERRAEEGLVEAIRECGELLAAHFPPRPDDTDELHNRLRTGG
jgi:putative membrane protein